MNGSPFTLVVTIGYDALLSGIGVAVTDTGTGSPPPKPGGWDARRGSSRWCSAATPIPLDVGRERRLFDRHQKIAINHRYARLRGAQLRPATRVDGVPPRGPLAPRRNTDAKKGISLCPPHHRMADHPDTYDMTKLPNGKVRFSRRT